MIASIHISKEIFAIDVLTALNPLGATSGACSAIVTTIWRPGFTKVLTRVTNFNNECHSNVGSIYRHVFAFIHLLTNVQLFGISGFNGPCLFDLI